MSSAIFAASSSSGTFVSPATGSNEAHQMVVDYDSPTAQSTVAPVAVAKQEFVEQELIPRTSRLSRLPSKVPSSPKNSLINPDKVAISVFQNNNATYTSQDVHSSVISSASSTSSTATRTFGQPSTPLETSVSSFSQPLQNHVLTHPIRRPRTSNTVFQSSTDLAAHYGIPQRLPPAPRTSTRYLQPPAPKQSSPLQDFQTLSANYLNMLSNKPTDTSVDTPSTPAMSSTLAPADLTAPVIPSNLSSSGEMTAEQITQLAEFIATSPEFRDSSDLFNDFMSSPLLPELDAEFGTSPLDTPYSEFLTTPLVNDDAMLTSPLMDYIDGPLFAGMDYYEKTEEVQVASKPALPTDFNDLYTISPATPALDSFDPAHLSLHHSAPTPAPAPRASTPAPTARRPKATGIRKGVTPETLLNEDAPTQPRKYTTPSATSRKDLPEVFRRKRARSVAFADEEDQLDELPPNPTEQDLIEQKRRQNTVAARRSRKRKLEQFQNMEASRNEERQLKEMWTNRANVLLQLVRSMGVNYPDFPEDEPKYADA